MRSAITLLVSFAAGAVLTYLFLRYVERRQIVAEENHRSMHKGRVATGGGLAMLAAALATVLALWPATDIPAAIWAALGGLAVVSWRDDVASVNPVLRLGIHIAAATALVASLPSDALVLQGWLPGPIDGTLSVIGLVWLMNLTNFMDGIDGIAGAEIAAIGTGYALVNATAGSFEPVLVGLALALAGAALGFLVWNWSPARIFMGDVGSVPAGFLAGLLLIDLATRTSLAAALILPAYFLADATITLIRRLMSGAKPWEAHRTHYYQRAAAALGSHSAVVKRVTVLNVALVAIALLALRAPWIALALAAASVALLLKNLEDAARSDQQD